MRIAQITCVFPPYKGGIGNSAYEISRRLALLGHEIDVYTASKDGKASESIADGVHVIRMKALARHGNAAILPIDGAILESYDLVHLHYPFYGTAEIVWLLKKMNPKVRLIIHFHMEARLEGFFLGIASLPDRILRRSLFHNSEAIICSSLDYAKQSFLGGFPELWNNNKVREIPFGVDLVRFSPIKGIKKEGDGKESNLQIIFVGGLDKAHYFKGVEVLLGALSKASRGNWRLSIVGKGELKGKYEGLARNLMISDKVEFLDDVSYDALPAAYAAADLLVLPSVNSGEAFGLVLLEAMASGVAVIASDLPGVRTVFRDGIEGRLVAPGYVDGLKIALESMMADAASVRIMGERGRKLAEEKYDWTVVAGKLDGLYKEVAGK